MKSYKAIERHARLFLLVSFLAEARKVHNKKSAKADFFQRGVKVRRPSVAFFSLPVQGRCRTCGCDRGLRPGRIISLFSFLRKRKGAQKKKLQRISLLLASGVLPLSLRDSRFTPIPAKIYDIKTEPRFSLRLGHRSALTTQRGCHSLPRGRFATRAAGEQVAVRSRKRSTNTAMPLWTNHPLLN